MQNSPARSVIEVGSVIDGTYTIEAMIGRGGMGAVYLASHRRLQGKKVAIKLLHADIGGDEVLARFKREADIASQLDHPNIVKVENYNTLPDGAPYIVYEYLQGVSLAQRIADRGAMPLESVFSILRQVGSALTAAHRAGIVHRDLKPANIFLVPTEADGRAVEVAKVLDFGISKIIGLANSSLKTQEATLLGTPQYMAPEQATGQHTVVDERTDIFALGAILYEMVSGRPAFTGANIPEVVFKVVYEQPPLLAEVAPNVADVVAKVIMKAMAKVPAERYATVNELVEALTGAPLSLVRKPKAAAAGNDAYAATMGSGDHGATPLATAEVPKVVRGSAPTLDSGSGMPVPSVVATASTVAAPESAAGITLAPAPRTSSKLIVGVAVVAVALGGGAVFFAMRGDGNGERKARDERVAKHDQPEKLERIEQPDKPVQPAHVDTLVVSTAPPVVPTAESNPPKPVAAVERAASPQGDKPKPPKPPKQTSPDITDDSAGDATVKQRLEAADAAFKAGDYEKVERLANIVTSSNVAGPVQVARAHMFHGMIECVAHNSDEFARIDLRHLEGHQNYRDRLLAVCHGNQLLMSDK